MNYVSVCSGIEAATVAWEPLGWRPLLFAEVAKFPSRVLAHHYPGVQNVGDFTQIRSTATPCDLLVGGTPCQAFSVAGLRGGLSDARGNLALEFSRLADRLRPRWVLWENVPGVLSSNGGRDFGSILGALAELGYGWAYRILDAQFIGVPQRRRRVFVVGYLGDWRRAAAVLFERTSLRRDTPKSRKAGSEIAGDVERGAGSGFGRDLERHGAFVIKGAAIGRNPSAGPQHGEVTQGTCYTLNCTEVHAVAQPIPFDETQITSKTNRSRPSPGDPSPTLARGARPPAIAFHIQQDPIEEEEVSLPLEARRPAVGVAVYGGGSGPEVRERDCGLSHGAHRRSL
jgi:DNA (cytosine-5)-methyltransferase 1